MYNEKEAIQLKLNDDYYERESNEFDKRRGPAGTRKIVEMLKDEGVKMGFIKVTNLMKD
jgi:hypothetical protein